MFDLVGSEWMASIIDGRWHARSGDPLSPVDACTGPLVADAWVYTRNGEYAVIFQGRPPPVHFYPDLDTARTALMMRGLLEK